jgi:hypothetical protein
MNFSPQSFRLGAQLRFLDFGICLVGAGWYLSCSGSEAPPSTSAVSTRMEKPVTKMEAFQVEESSSPKTHTLFMGADISIALDKSVYPVNDVDGDDWVIDIAGKKHEVSAKVAPLSLRITPNLKLTEAGVTITGFKRIQTYSFNNDPGVLLTRGLSRSSALNSDLVANSQNAQYKQDALQNHALGGASLLAGSDDQFSENALLTSAQFAYSNSHPTILDSGGLPLPSPNAPSTNTNTTGYVVLPGMQIFATESQKLGVGIAQQSARDASKQAENGDEATGKMVTAGLDAMDVAFEIRSKKILRNPYVVTMSRFRAKESKPGMVQNLVYAKSLDPIEEHASHVHFVEEGFPMGFELLDFQLHVYDHGVEVGTNLSSDRVDLTRDEAFEYIKMEYLGAHRSDSASPSIALSKLPSDLRDKLSSGKYREPFYVKVSETGYSLGCFTDRDCITAVEDPYITELINNLRFKPALAKGKAIQGMAEISLPKLAS